ncbi:MAG: FG-GAP-like repeat-containing protein [Actinomycetota bacterium]
MILVLSGLGSVARVEAAPPNDQLAVLTGWNVGAMPRACTNDGAGNWTGCVNIPITDAQPDGTSSAEAGDWNNDGIADVVIANQNGTLSTCIQGAAGGWTCTANGATGRHRGIGVGDFNGDGNQDVVGAIETMSNMDVCLGDGTGGFSCTRVAAPNGGRDLTVNDFDGDGDEDFAYAAWPGPSALCANDGAANFICTTITGTGNNLGVDQGDLDADGDQDLVFGGGGTTDELACLGDGAGTFTCAAFNAGGYHSQIGLGYLDGDAVLDVVVGGDGVSSLSCLGTGTGTFTGCTAIATAPTNVGSLDLGDIDGDGNLDMLMGSVGGVNQSCLGDGAGGFTCTDIDSPNAWNTQGVLLLDPIVAAPDADGDGEPDATDNCPAVANADQTDTDGDGSGDACDTDDDGDGLTDGNETTVYFTNPLLADTDGDGLDDSDELFVHSTDPNLADTDGDSLTDHAEVITHGTDPLLADTDGDGHDDDVELANGSDPTVPASPQAIVLPTPPDITFDVGSFAVAPTADSALPVTLVTTGACTSAGFTVTATAVGTCNLTLDQPGDYDWQPAPTVNLAVQIDPGVQAITHDPLPTLTFGDPTVALVATATSGLPVTITASGPCAVSGTDLDITGAGSCTVDFDQPGDATWAAATTVTAVVGIAQANQIITVTPPADMTYTAAPQTLAATATSALPVTMTAAGECTLAGTEVTPTGAGTCTITYEQAGDADWSAAPTESETFTIAPAPQSIALNPVADRYFDQGDLEMNVTATSGLPITLVAEGACVADGLRVAPTGVGLCQVTATQLGDGDWLAAPSATIDFAVAPGRQVITFAVPGGAVFGDDPLALSVTASSGLPVTTSARGACALLGTSILLTGGGTCTLVANQAGSVEWSAAVAVEVSFTVGRADQSIATLSPRDRAFDAAPWALIATASSGLPVGFSATGACEIVDGELVHTRLGECQVTAFQSGDQDWNAAPTLTETYDITPGRAVLTIETDTVGVSDEPQPAVISVDPPDLDGVEIRYDGELDVPGEPGTYALAVTLDNPHFLAEETEGIFTVVEPPVIDSEVEYRFVSATVEDVVADGLPEPAAGGLVLTVTGLAEGTEVTLSDRAGTLEATADEAGFVVLRIEPGFDLTEATLLITDAETTTVVTTEDVATVGDSRLALAFELDAGEPVGNGTVAIEGTGMAPGSTAEVVVHSDPIVIGTVTADDDGAFAQALPLPAELPSGEHRVLVQAATDDGPLVGTWFFAVESSGEVVRIGDPPEPAPELLAFAADDDDGSAGIVPNPAQTPDPTAEEVPAVIDVETGLPVYDPVADPEETVETGVDGFTIVTVATAAAGSVAAMGAMTPTAGGGGATPARSSGGSSPGAARRSGAGGRGKESDEDGERGKGRIVSGNSDGMGDGLDAVAWGDASATWRWPLVFGLDRMSRSTPDRLRPVSPLMARVVADGSTLRALFGTGALLAPILGVVLGMLAVIDTGGTAVVPATALLVALLVLGIYDTSAGAVATVTFAVGVGLSGGLVSTDSFRMVMGIGSLWYAVALVAGGARQFRRPPAESWDDRWRRVADVVIGSLLGAWTVQTVLKALPGLTGVAVPIAERADRVALVALIALVGRYLLERTALRLYPERMVATAPIEESEEGPLQKVWSNVLKAAVFVFVMEPYIGLVWQLGVVVLLMVGPSMAKIGKKRLPNSRFLHRILPSGVPAILFFLVIGKTVGAELGDRIEDPANLIVVSFMVLSIPSFVSSVAGLFGRDGDDLDPGWGGRVAGLGVAVVAIAAVQGAFDGPLITWVPLAVAPSFLWWAATAVRTGFPDLELDGDEQPEAEGDEPPPDAERPLVGAH